ncbi:hypothetical protein GLAREA_07689 [Glarea lozoyensis ATCC 20868]|uniref:Uncharacterized protein n=1 Tax=Glarea lozoyensis (strain ATCC 20868 / MF5171) TaxID=1116229 RepID=S3D412_GLAL2|nr:uncharacterized protein GLAREA_07689 [Glarea lozoyensis ATCC 20868]EPE32555.1 hypothetical protein GLAREA_07689 [Glarea lozoyensis ATCC 20868]
MKPGKTQQKQKAEGNNKAKAMRNRGTKVLLTGRDPIKQPTPSVSQLLREWCFPPAPTPCAISQPTIRSSSRAGSFDGDLPRHILQTSSTPGSDNQRSGKSGDLLSGPTYRQDEETIYNAEELVSPSNISSENLEDVESRKKKRKRKIRSKKGWLGFSIIKCKEDFTIQDGGLKNVEDDEDCITYDAEHDGFVFVDFLGLDDAFAPSIMMPLSRSQSEDEDSSDPEDNDDFQNTLEPSSAVDPEYKHAGPVARAASPELFTNNNGSQSDLEEQLNEAMESSLPRLTKPPVKVVGRLPKFALPINVNDTRSGVAKYLQSLSSARQRQGASSTGPWQIMPPSPEAHSFDAHAKKTSGPSSVSQKGNCPNNQGASDSSLVTKQFLVNPPNSPSDDVKMGDKLLRMGENQDGYTDLEESIELVMDEYLARSAESDFSEPYPDDLELQEEARSNSPPRDLRHSVFTWTTDQSP